MSDEPRKSDTGWWVLFTIGLVGLVFVGTDPILGHIPFGANGVHILGGAFVLIAILINAKVEALTIRELAVSMLGFIFLGVIYYISLRYWGTSAWPIGERRTYGEYPYRHIETIAFTAPIVLIAANCIFRVRWWLSGITWLLSIWMIFVTMIVFWED